MGDFKVLKKKDLTLVEYAFFVPMSTFITCKNECDWTLEFMDACQEHGYTKPTNVVAEWQFDFLKNGYDTVIRAWVERADETKPATS